MNKPTKNLKIGTVIVVSALLITGCIQSWSQHLQDQLKSIFGSDIAKWYWPTVLVNNFGLGSAYNGSVTSDPIDLKQNFICTIPNLIGKDDPTNEVDLQTMYGYADCGQGGGLVSLSQSDENDFSFSVLMPQMLSALKISANADWTNNVNANVSFGNFYERVLIPDKYDRTVMADTNFPALKTAYFDGNLIVACSDIVLNGLSVNLTLTNAFNAGLSAALSNAALGSVVGSNATINVAVNHNSDGSYTITNNHPVVIAVLYKKLPAGTNSLLSAYSLEKPANVKSLVKYWEDSKQFMDIKIH